MVIETMASQGKEPTFCMGDDIPLAVLSQKPHMLFDYFKQRFAQVSEFFGPIMLCLLTC
jgi:glutamate synthase (ferredoxin)